VCTQSSSLNYIMALAALLLAVGAPIVLRNAPYHVKPFSQATSCLLERDVHMLTGNITAHGGTLSVHVLNSTWTGGVYTITVGPETGTKPRPVESRSVAASWSCAGTLGQFAGTALLATGRLEELTFSHQKEGHAFAVLYEGPNPPPPPPPRPACGKTFNQSACDTVPPVQPGSKACTWCKSKDGVHE
jgi:hypothetical protein